MTDVYTITLKNCAFFARHGVYAEEEFLGQRFFVDAELDVSAGAALDNDDIDGTVVDLPPADRDAWDRAVPIYEELPGWKVDTTACRNYDELPANAKAYLTRFAELCGAPVAFVGVGPDREQTIVA